MFDLIPTQASVRLEALEGASKGGLLPPWGSGWNEETWHQLVPNPIVRAQFRRDLPPIPLSLYTEQVPVTSGWPDAACSYIKFSEFYSDAQIEARKKGWRTLDIPGAHLQMLVQPDEVTAALVKLVE